MYFQELWESCAQNKTSEVSKIRLSRIHELLCAEQDVGHLKKYIVRTSGTPVRRTKRRTFQTCTFSNSGTPVRRTTRRKSKKMHFQKLWDSKSQNQTSGISTSALSQFLGLRFAEQTIGNLKKCNLCIAAGLGIWRRLALRLPCIWGTLALQLLDMRDTGSPAARYEGYWLSSCQVYEGYWLSSCRDVEE